VVGQGGDGHCVGWQLAITDRDGIDVPEEGALARRQPWKWVTGSVYQHASRRAPGLC
jgi:hypothetical protein